MLHYTRDKSKDVITWFNDFLAILLSSIFALCVINNFVFAFLQFTFCYC